MQKRKLINSDFDPILPASKRRQVNANSMVEQRHIFPKCLFGEQITQFIFLHLKQWFVTKNGDFPANDDQFWQDVLNSHFPSQPEIKIGNKKKYFLREFEKILTFFLGEKRTNIDILKLLTALRGQCDNHDMMSMVCAITNGHTQLITQLPVENYFCILTCALKRGNVVLFEKLLQDNVLKKYAAQENNFLLENALNSNKWKICLTLLQNPDVMKEAISQFDEHVGFMPPEYANACYQLLLDYLKLNTSRQNDFLAIKTKIKFIENQNELEVVDLINNYISNYGIEVFREEYKNCALEKDRLVIFCCEQNFFSIGTALSEAILVFEKSEEMKIRKLMSAMSRKYFNDADEAFHLNLFLNSLKKKIKPYPSKDYNHAHELQEEYLKDRQKLLGTDFPNNMATSFEEGIKNVLYQLAEIFDNPENCKKYLIRLDQKIAKYYKQMHDEELPQINPDTYEYRIFDSYRGNTNNCFHYPVPKSDQYQGIKKHNAVENCLLTLLEKHNVAKKKYKLIGFIPEIIADVIFGNGSFLLEQTLGISELVHGKNIHMVQHAVLAMALKDMYTQYIDNEGCVKNITLSEILHETVNLNLWSRTRDTADYNGSFNSPHAFFTYILNNRNDLKTLSSCMIDSFCKGLIRCFQGYKKINPQAYQNFDEFVSHLEELELRLFFTFPKLLEYSIEHEMQKGRTIYAKGNRFAVIEKKYTPFKTLTTNRSSVQLEKEEAKEMVQSKNTHQK